MQPKNGLPFLEKPQFTSIIPFFIWLLSFLSVFLFSLFSFLLKNGNSFSVYAVVFLPPFFFSCKFSVYFPLFYFFFYPAFLQQFLGTHFGGLQKRKEIVVGASNRIYFGRKLPKRLSNGLNYLRVKI